MRFVLKPNSYIYDGVHYAILHNPRSRPEDKHGKSSLQYTVAWRVLTGCKITLNEYFHDEIKQSAYRLFETFKCSHHIHASHTVPCFSQALGWWCAANIHRYNIITIYLLNIYLEEIRSWDKRCCTNPVRRTNIIYGRNKFTYPVVLVIINNTYICRHDTFKLVDGMMYEIQPSKLEQYFTHCKDKQKVVLIQCNSSGLYMTRMM